MATALRPLSTGELLDRTFSLYRNHFVLFVGIFALPHLCVLAFQGAIAARFHEGDVGRLHASSDAGQAGSAAQSRVDDSGESQSTAGNRGHRHKLLISLGVPDGI